MRNLVIFLITILPFYSMQAQDPGRFSSEITEFLNADKKSPPSSGSILFIGSSSFRMWHSITSDFKKYPVINRGFGGSQISDVNHYFDDIAAPYNPQMVVLYCGENDLAAGKDVEEVLSELVKFIDKVRNISSQIPILYISAKPSPLRWNLKDEIEVLNEAASRYCHSLDNVYYIDIFNPMLGKNGKPIPELYVADSLHMSPSGYKIWKKEITPYLKKYYRRDKAAAGQNQQP